MILITGGTGTLGSLLVKSLMDNHEVRVFSRDELKQSKLKKEVNDRVQFVLGDVRDRESCLSAMVGITHVIHAAALKQIDTLELHPLEALKTNINGTLNMLQSAAGRVKKFITVSTDKACLPVNLYGKTKSIAEHLTLWMNKQNWPKTKYSVVRYGNVLGSRGSVLNIFAKQIAEGKPVTVTDEYMTRFWITPSDAATLVLSCLKTMKGGEIFIPKLKGSYITDLVKAISAIYKEVQCEKTGFYPEGETKIVSTGIRGNEKLIECMVPQEGTDVHTLVDGDIESSMTPCHRRPEEVVKPYDSSSCEHYSLEELITMIKPYVRF